MHYKFSSVENFRLKDFTERRGLKPFSFIHSVVLLLPSLSYKYFSHLFLYKPGCLNIELLCEALVIRRETRNGLQPLNMHALYRRKGRGRCQWLINFDTKREELYKIQSNNNAYKSGDPPLTRVGSGCCCGVT